MITWMQKHKKWLVITIWISTIAFVGAGFVGWGSYDYGKTSGSVAVVGDREITLEEYQQEYSTLYEQYARVLGNSFNDEMAKTLNLQDAAYNQVVQKNLILSYGDSLGLDVTNEDIAKELVKYQAFLKDGKFDKDTYIKVLAQNRMKPVDFEKSLKRNILLQKIQSFFTLNSSKVEIENLSKLLFVEDDINIEILNSSDITVEVKEDALKKYWLANENSYLSEVKYVIQSFEMPVISSNADDARIKSHYDKFKTDYKKEDGKIKSLEEAKADVLVDLDKKASKKDALKKYLKAKKGEITLSANKSFDISKLPFNAELNSKITGAKPGDLLKPVFSNGKYMIVKVLSKIDAKPLSFDLAKPQAQIAFVEAEKKSKLEEMAKEQASTFTGTNIAAVSRSSVDKIVGLSPQEASQFLTKLFSTTTKEGYLNIGDKTVLYRINDSKLASYDNTKDEMVKSTISQLQSQELMANLIKRLESKYEVQSSINTKEK